MLNDYFCTFSEDDITLVKSSLHLFGTIHVGKKYQKECMYLVIFVIRLVLAVLLKLFNNKNNLVNDSENAKHKISKLLKEKLNYIATKICDISVFQVDVKSRRLVEMQVKKLYLECIYIIFILVLDSNL